MAQTGYTPIQLYRTTTASATPTAGNLTDGELAINTTDEKLYFKNASGTVKLLAANVMPVANGGTGATTASVALTNLGAVAKAGDTMTGVLAFTAGTVSAPGITFSGDTNTGIFSPAADTIAFTEGGVESMRIDSSGNVGIGTSSPGALLQLNKGSGAADFRLSVAGTLYGNIYASSSDMTINSVTAIPLSFGTNSTERMRIDTSGNVGIGTSSPAARMDVRGAIYAANTASAYLALNHDGSNGAITNNTGGMLFYANGANSIVWHTNGSERARIDSSGNVGIGTSSPKAQTHVFGLGQTTAALTDAGNRGGMLRVSDNSSSAGAGGAILFSSAQGDTANSTGFAAIKGLLLDGSGNTVGDLSFSTRNGTADTSLTERFRIGASGQLGIGGANYGTSGQVLTSNGSGSAPSWQAAGGSTGALKNVQVFTSSGTYTRTSGVTTAVVICRGGGGGSTASITNGGTGGTTSFGSHVTAVGGSGSASNANASLDGGNGGTGGTGATIAIRGAPGGGTVVKDNTDTTANLRGYGGGEGGGVGGTGTTATAGVRGGGASGGQRLDGPTYRVGAGGGQGEFAMKYTTTVGATETVTIGAGGTAATGGAAGGAGYIIVYEYS